MGQLSMDGGESLREIVAMEAEAAEQKAVEEGREDTTEDWKKIDALTDWQAWPFLRLVRVGHPGDWQYGLLFEYDEDGNDDWDRTVWYARPGEVTDKAQRRVYPTRQAMLDDGWRVER